MKTVLCDRVCSGMGYLSIRVLEISTAEKSSCSQILLHAKPLLVFLSLERRGYHIKAALLLCRGAYFRDSTDLDGEEQLKIRLCVICSE